MASSLMRQVEKVLARAAAARMPVVLWGPSGVGKERLGRQLHLQGPRSAGPFEVVACGAIPSGLVDSVLFGHVKGAFSGATSDAVGHFVAADGGTLFLDEVGALPLALQPRLLRAVEDGTVQPVGGQPRRVDVRVVVASQRRLDDLVADGLLRADLGFRLQGVVVHIPALRERPADLAILLDEACAQYGVTLSGTAQEALLAYTWPGNARELLHAVEALSVLLEKGLVVQVQDLPERMVGHAPPSDGPSWPLDGSLKVKDHTAALETLLLREALRRTEGNRSAAALLCGLSRRAFLYKLRAYGLEDRFTDG